MIARATFSFIAVFWVTMNVLLWRAEFGGRHGGMAVPVDLVWRKILTAPDASALSVYQHGARTGFCELSTSVEREMAKLDEDNPPPEGLVARAGYQFRINGNIGLGSFTNRVKFDALIQFAPDRAWREMHLKLSARGLTLEIHSFAAEQNFHFKVTGDSANGGGTIRFADLQNPAALLQSVAGNLGGGLELPVLPPLPDPPALAQAVHWEAHRDRLLVGGEQVSAYRLETQLLQNKIVIYASTLGEILRVELPGGVTAVLDAWTRS